MKECRNIIYMLCENHFRTGKENRNSNVPVRGRKINSHVFKYPHTNTFFTYTFTEIKFYSPLLAVIMSSKRKYNLCTFNNKYLTKVAIKNFLL